jgi:hypothetical protein
MTQGTTHIDGLIGEAYNSVKTFNLIADNIGNNTTQTLKERLLNQVKIIQSELDEFKKGIEEDDVKETLDGVDDLVVTAFGAMQMVDESLRAREALLDVCANNLTKYVQVTNPNARNIIEVTVEKYKSEGVEIDVHYNKTFGVYVFKDKNGKIRKPCNYKNVDLSSYVNGLPT